MGTTNPNVDAQFARTMRFRNLRKYPDELECYDSILKIDPKLTKVWYRKGLAFARMKKDAEAIECYDEALAINYYLPDIYYTKKKLHATAK